MLLHGRKSLCETAAIERNISDGIIFVERVLFNLIEIVIKNKKSTFAFFQKPAFATASLTFSSSHKQHNEESG
jgi:hypothetical protein